MIPLVENVLTEIIEARLKFVRENIDIVDKIFSNATLTLRNRLKEYLAGGKVKVLRGYPMDRTTLPCYVIMLGGEREQEKALGSIFDDEESFDVENISEVQTIFLHEGFNVIQVKHRPLFTINSISYDGVPIDDFEVINYNLGLVRINSEHITEGSEISLNYAYKSQGYEVQGSMFNTQYRIETWTNNGDLTVMLYHLLKWIILSSRDYLELKGLAVQTVGGLDFEPAPEYYPEFVYRRALTFECVTQNSFDVEFFYIQNIFAKGGIMDA